MKYECVVLLSSRLQAAPAAAPEPNIAVPSINPIFKCPKCKRHHMSLRSKRDNKGFFFTCLGRPECDHAIWLADVIKEVKVLDQNCNKCNNQNKSIAIKFRSNTLLAMLNASLINDNDRTYVSCILCDNSLRVILEINDAQMRGAAGGFASQANNRSGPPQNAVRTNTNPRPTAPNNMPANTRPPPNRSVPNPRPNSNANQSGRDGGGDEPKCSGCNRPVIK